ncbi:MAG: hypothetical protein FWH26_04285 [Oscillospiraceae bacterium]|nr:hypothetical protein [Oscillospiraceae bacterium]
MNTVMNGGSSSGISINASDDRLSVESAGIYLVSFSVQFSSASTGTAELIVLVNGAAVPGPGARAQLDGGGSYNLAWSQILSLEAGDTVSLSLAAGSGGINANFHQGNLYLLKVA